MNELKQRLKNMKKRNIPEYILFRIRPREVTLLIFF